ncbi:hypothetical protein TWF281_009808 [Arthrobotrys megalospora]
MEPEYVQERSILGNLHLSVAPMDNERLIPVQPRYVLSLSLCSQDAVLNSFQRRQPRMDPALVGPERVEVLRC